MKSWVKSKGIETQFELAGEFELFEFELPGFLSWGTGVRSLTS